MSIYHPDRDAHPPQPYHEVNSLRGVRHGKMLGYDEIDLDMLITKADPACPHCADRCRGHLVNTHWDRPMLRDDFVDRHQPPLRVRTMVRDMTLDQALRLRTRHGNYEIQTVRRVLVECGRQKIGARVEPKNDPRFAEDWPWEEIALVRDATPGLKVKVYGFQAANVAAARRNGFKASRLR